MLLGLIGWLESAGYKVPHFWLYYSTRMMLACLTAFVLWMLLGPWFIKKLYEWKVGQKIRMEECPLLGQLHEKKKETPTMGGALTLIIISFCGFLWMDLTHLYTWLLFAGTWVLGGLGAYDDFLKLKWKDTRGVSPRKKMRVQLGLGLAIAAILLIPQMESIIPLHFPKALDMSFQSTSTGAWLTTSQMQHLLYIPCFKLPLEVPFTWIMLICLMGFFCFVITGSSNSVNLTDGLDGLASGTIILSAMCLTVAAFISNHQELTGYLNWLYIEGSGEVAIFLSALIGASIGFLWFNCAPAQVFMGDTGSLGMGGALGIAAILLRREFFFAIASGIFVFEAISVIVQVYSMRRYKKRVFLCTPIHHHFEYKGWAETKVVIRFWIVAGILALVALMTIKLQ